jgi:hypothetical protein
MNYRVGSGTLAPIKLKAINNRPATVSAAGAKMQNDSGDA